MGKDKRRLSISFRKEHHHIFEHLMTVVNKSDFIAKALEAYITDGGQSSISHKEVRRIVAEILQDRSKTDQTFIQSSTSLENQISEEDAELLSQLF